MYESSVRVPLTITWPKGLPKGLRVHTPVGGVDLAPTLAGLAGLGMPEAIDGRSLAEPLQSGNEPIYRPVFAEIANNASFVDPESDAVDLASRVTLIDEGWKYVWRREGDEELYDLADDPDELYNHADEPGCRNRIKGIREAIRAIVEKSGPGPYAWVM